ATPRSEALPGGGLPGPRRPGGRGARRGDAGRRHGRDAGGRRGGAGAGLLPRPLRQRTSGDAGRAAAGASDRRAPGGAAGGGAGMTRVFVPKDAAARAVGADAVAEAIAAAAAGAGRDVEIVRTGSRGLFALEPLVEVETADGRIGYGPVEVADVDG